jgi:hypothetical protein
MAYHLKPFPIDAEAIVLKTANWKEPHDVCVYVSLRYHTHTHAHTHAHHYFS